MMSPASTLLTELTRQGIELQPHGDLLRYRPRSAMTPELIERVMVHKADLLTALAADRDQLKPETTAGEWRTYHLTLARRWERKARMCNRQHPKAAAEWRWRAARHWELAASTEGQNDE